MRSAFLGGRAVRIGFFLALAQLLEVTLCSATLFWDANKDSITAGYRVYVRRGLERFQFDVGAQTNLVLDFVKPGSNYKFEVTAYTRRNVESAPSDILDYLVPIPFGWPVFLRQPEPLDVVEDAPAFFVVQVAGIDLKYQWAKDGVDIPGATNIFLSIPSVSKTDSGLYSARAINLLGEVESEAVALSLLSPPTIVRQERLIQRRVGDAFSLWIDAAGTAPLEYTWFKGSTMLKEGAGPDLLIPEATLSDAGFYTVIVSNRIGSVTSLPIEVIVAEVKPPVVRVENFDSALLLTVSGDPFSSYAIEALSDLESSWVFFADIIADEEGGASIVINADEGMGRFFRAVLLDL